MAWLKNVVVDLAVTVLIVLATTLDLAWARWFVLIYTPLMVMLKIVAVLGSESLGKLKQKATAVPVWFYHVLYAVNVVVAGVDQWWLIAGGWVVIWGLSVVADARTHLALAK